MCWQQSGSGWAWPRLVEQQRSAGRQAGRQWRLLRGGAAVGHQKEVRCCAVQAAADRQQRLVGLRLSDCCCGTVSRRHVTVAWGAVCASAGHATCAVQCWEKKLGAELFLGGAGQEGAAGKQRTGCAVRVQGLCPLTGLKHHCAAPDQKFTLQSVFSGFTVASVPLPCSQAAAVICIPSRRVGQLPLHHHKIHQTNTFSLRVINHDAAVSAREDSSSSTLEGVEQRLPWPGARSRAHTVLQMPGISACIAGQPACAIAGQQQQQSRGGSTSTECRPGAQEAQRQCCCTDAQRQG